MDSIYNSINELKNEHIKYIEANYHLHNPRLIQERHLLMQNGGVSTEAWIEATPIYQKGKKFSEIGLPEPVTNILNRFSDLGLGVFDPPYQHQAEALTSFFNENKNLVISTGTGSGKTEIFLYSILGSLAIEAKRNISTKKRGFRAIILYPMNALVSDQLSRLRRLFGNDSGSQQLKSYFGRYVQFGMYTSRTPYHGQYNVDKNDRVIKPIINYYYNLQETNPSLFNELKSRGKIPSKDLRGFYNIRNRNLRYHTQPSDVELFTRQEMHTPNEYGGTPDILITNYSMLEYMLLRPIEQSLFNSTRDWLDSDINNKLIVVIDEAHLYRGAQGAEVALLIRRLLQHLNIAQSRVRFILTSASLGNDEKTKEVGPKFASDLTGAPEDQFKVILGTRRKLSAGPKGTEAIANAYQNVNYQFSFDKINQLSKAEGWSLPSKNNESDLRLFLGKQLVDTSTFRFIHDYLSTRIVPIKKLANEVFPGINEKTSIDATLNLLYLSSQSWTDSNQSLMPVRIHMFFKGLPKQYACLNPNCICRRAKDENNKLLGKIYTEPRFLCECGSRVFELLSHRTCGAAYIKAFRRKDDKDPDQTFLWADSEDREDMEEVHILMEPPRSDPDVNNAKHIPLSLRTPSRYLDIQTGYLVRTASQKDDRFIKVWIPTEAPKIKGAPWSWTQCPVCGIKENQRPEGQTYIMDLETKGEEIFANLVKTLFQFQPVLYNKKDLPNKGKKVLCFSDGRQKAARLARDLQRTVELDSFREVVSKVISELPEKSNLSNLYPKILVYTSKININFFDDGDQFLSSEGYNYDGSRTIFITAQRSLPDLIKKYTLLDDNELVFDKDAKEDLNNQRPRQYNAALLRLLGDRFYSISASLIAYLIPTDDVLKQIETLNPTIDKNLLREIIIHVLKNAASYRAFDPQISNLERKISRISVSYPEGYPLKQECLELDKIIPDNIRERVGNLLNNDQWNSLKISFIRSSSTSVKLFASSPTSNGRYAINPEAVRLKLALDEPWYRCIGCRQFFASPLAGRCPDCNGSLEKIDDYDKHMIARKSLFRDPCKRVVHGDSTPFTLRSEEHSAQLSHRDNAEIFAKTEEYELSFQDIFINEKAVEQPIDVLSCTTTMEVGIDIGSLTGVALRTVPPRTENYQQRAGRAGRRGSALSTIITFADNSPHESYYFNNPNLMIGASASELVIYVGNKKICERHINASLIQKFFQRNPNIDINSDVFSSLGSSYSFFRTEGDYSLEEFNLWINNKILAEGSQITQELASLLPDALISSINYSGKDWREHFICDTAVDLLTKLAKLSNETDWDKALEREDTLLETLLDAAFLPTFSFPIDVCTFTVQEIDRSKYKVVTKYEMSQELQQALSEYIPGRQIVVDKKTFSSSGLFIPFSSDSINRASGEGWDNLEWLNYCEGCKTIIDEKNSNLSMTNYKCPICNSDITSINLYTPKGFSPIVDPVRGVLEGERQEEERVYATSAQFPLPVAPLNNVTDSTTKHLKNGDIRNLSNQELLVVNFGPNEEGFEICTQCGAVGDSAGLTNPHNRPYPLNPRDKGVRRQCNGIHKKTTLGYSFRTDLAILRIKIKSPLNLDPKYPWFIPTVKSLSEALVLGASRTLGIDNNELAGGHRLLQPFPDDDSSISGYIEIYVYDKTPSGAGFASKTYNNFSQVMDSAQKILTNCNCSQSCHSCLRTYNNRIWHNNLDRHLGLALLNYVKDSSVPSLDIAQKKIFANQLKLTLELMDTNISFNPINNRYDEWQAGLGDKKVNVSIKHCLIDTAERASNNIKVTCYEIQHDLPSCTHKIYDALQKL